MPSRWWLRVALAILVPAWFLSAARLRMHYLTIVAGGISPPDYGRPAAREHDDGGAGALLCRRIASSLDPSSWPDAIYHKDRGAPGGDLLGGAPPLGYDSDRFESVEEEDDNARSTVGEFNALRGAVLTPRLLDSGFSTGRPGPARAFAARLRASLESSSSSSSSSGRRRGRRRRRPLIVAVFGSSFTVGSNCGESSIQSERDDCAWPARLARRFDDVFPRGGGGENSNTTSSSSSSSSSSPPAALVEFRMYQENAQGSANIAQKLPSILDDFRNRNEVPDAILLDNSITDLGYGMSKPWFEAVVRALLQSYPEAVVLSLVDAVPQYVDLPGNRDYKGKYAKWMRRVQEHYGLAVVNVADMVRHLRLLAANANANGTSGGGDHHHHDDTVRRSIGDYRQRQRRQHPVVVDGGAYKNENSGVVDLLWPQADVMITSDGAILRDGDYMQNWKGVYFLNFLPLTRKTKIAWYPQNHPPWPTHQYVADAVMRALLGVAAMGLGCGGGGGGGGRGDDGNNGRVGRNSSSSYSPEETVSPRETLKHCFICRSPTTRIDAKSPHHAGGRSVANLTSSAPAARDDDDHRAAVAVTCGDWRWTTDSRKRSGWQSDRGGSLMRFRLGIGGNGKLLPTLSLTYMRSHESFGRFLVTFRAVSRREANGPSSPPSLLGCDDVGKFRDIGGGADFDAGGKYSNDSTLIPSLELDGTRAQYSLWETVVFPGKLDNLDVNSRRPWYLLNRTVLSRIMMAGSNDEDVVEYVDLYLMNPNERRIKVQVVTSC